jgi:hypothetical protein
MQLRDLGVRGERGARLFTGDDAVTDLVRDRAGDLDAALDGIAGRREWGVKFYRAAEPATADDAAERATVDDAAGRDGAAAAGPGTTYLLRRRAQQRAAHAADAAATAAGRATHAELARLAEDQRTYPPQDPRLDPAAAAMTLNATYLVRDDQASAFLDAIDRCRREHRAVRIEVTGPWPAYAFASMTLGAAR